MTALLFANKSSSKHYQQYNQTLILDSRHRIDENLLKKQGLPNMTSTHILGMTVVNMAIMAAISHMVLWHWNDIKSAFEFGAPIKKLFRGGREAWKFWKPSTNKMTYEEAEKIDPHYALMQAYEDVPSWWFGTIWIISACVGLITSRMAGSTLEWWAFLIAIAIAGVSLTFFASLVAMFGFNLNVQPLIQSKLLYDYSTIFKPTAC